MPHYVRLDLIIAHKDGSETSRNCHGPKDGLNRFGRHHGGLALRQGQLAMPSLLR